MPKRVAFSDEQLRVLFATVAKASADKKRFRTQADLAMALKHCPVDEIGKGARVRIAGASKWSVDGSYGTAVEQWTALDAQGKAMCTGTYDVTLTKQ